MNKNEKTSEQSIISSPTIYETIANAGQEELSRPFQSLIWSALAAGLLISFSLLVEGVLKKHSTGIQADFLFYNIGYTVGFILVIIGRFQLFTENTITPILPLYNAFTRKNLIKTGRLWGIVLSFNLVGTFLIASILAFSPYISNEQLDIFIQISEDATKGTFNKIFFLAIPAGFLIACLVWLLPSAANSQITLIFLVTYIIAVFDFTHIVAGSTEVFLLLLLNNITVFPGVSFLIAATLGNIIGGTFLFALMAYAQVRKEL